MISIIFGWTIYNYYIHEKSKTSVTDEALMGTGMPNKEMTILKV